MNLTNLIGERSQVAANFRLVDKVDTSNYVARRHGVGPLGVHYQLNLALDEEFGMPEWGKWVDAIWTAVGSLYTNNHTPSYTRQQLSYWLVMAMYTHLALTEARRDIKMLQWTTAEDANARRDYWGAAWESARDMAGGEYPTLIDHWNTLAKDFYVQVPFRTLNYISFVDELLSKVWRDDKTGRTNYLYFHLFDNYYAVDDTLVNCRKPLSRAFQRLEAWIYGKEPVSKATGYGRFRLPDDVRFRIKSDLIMVFPDALHTVPTMSKDEPIFVDYSEDLLRALNQSPLGIPEVVDVESLTANNVGGTLFETVSSAGSPRTDPTWLNPVQQFTALSGDATKGAFPKTFDDLAFVGAGTDEGPAIVSVYSANWDTALSAHCVSVFERACYALNHRNVPLTAYASFNNGADILGDFSFTPIIEFATAAKGEMRDDEPTFSHTAGNLAVQAHGLFGFCVTRVWSYNYSSWALESAVPQMVFAIPSSLIVYGSSITLPPMGICNWFASRQNGLSTYKSGVANSLALANSIDAVTTYQWQSTSSGNIVIVSDEDIDEWAPTTLQQIENGYAATAQGMFIDKYIVNSKSNRVEDAKSSPNVAGISRTERSRDSYRTSSNYKNKRGGRYHGKGKR